MFSNYNELTVDEQTNFLITYLHFAEVFSRQ
jgi:hypothetical protein